MRDFPFHTALTIALFGAAVGAPHLFRPVPVPPPVVAPEPAAPAVPRPPDPLLDDSNGALVSFYTALTRTEAKQPGAITRIVHYGDSPTTADLITGDVRTILQLRFGSAGHGFILPAKPWAWYQHAGTSLEGKGWQFHAASQFKSLDGLFGLGGVSFAGTSATSRIQFDQPQNRFELWFERQPGGGTVVMSADDAELGRVDTDAEKEPGFAAFEAPALAHTLALRTSGGPVRLFGVTAESAGPGVVYDSLGLNGASTTVLSRMFNQEHWAAELQHRSPNLVIVNYGTNEADFPDFVGQHYEQELREAIRRLHAALPKTSILIMSPMDRGQRNSSGEIETMATIPQLVATQRRVAMETGCAFFDTYRAMGGQGTMARWYSAKPRLVSADFIHPYPAGGAQIAQIFTRELIAGLGRYQVATAPRIRPKTLR